MNLTLKAALPAVLIIMLAAAACGDATPEEQKEAMDRWANEFKAELSSIPLLRGPNENNPAYFPFMPQPDDPPGARAPRAGLRGCQRDGVTAGIPAEDEDALVTVKEILDGRTIIPNTRRQPMLLWGISPNYPSAPAAQAAKENLSSMLETLRAYRARIISSPEEGPIIAELFDRQGRSVNHMMVAQGKAMPDAAGNRNECLATARRFARMNGLTQE